MQRRVTRKSAMAAYTASKVKLEADSPDHSEYDFQADSDDDAWNHNDAVTGTFFVCKKCPAAFQT